MKLTINIRTFFLVFLFVISCNSKKQQNSNQDSVAKDPATENRQSADSINEIKDPGNNLVEIDEPDRGSWQNPALVIKKLGDLEGKCVADIGSGTGYFTIPLSASAKKVIAVDIAQEFLDYIEELKLELPLEQADKIETRLSVVDDPFLKPGEADAVLIVNVYYYLKNRVAYMRKIKEGLNKEGILVLVDFKTRDMPVGPVENKISVQTASEELKKAGFTILEVDTESLPYQYIIKAK